MCKHQTKPGAHHNPTSLPLPVATGLSLGSLLFMPQSSAQDIFKCISVRANTDALSRPHPSASDGTENRYDRRRVWMQHLTDSAFDPSCRPWPSAMPCCSAKSAKNHLFINFGLPSKPEQTLFFVREASADLGIGLERNRSRIGKESL